MGNRRINVRVCLVRRFTGFDGFKDNRIVSKDAGFRDYETVGYRRSVSCKMLRRKKTMTSLRVSLIAIVLWAGSSVSDASAQAPDAVLLDRAGVEALLSGNSLAGNGNLKDPTKPYDWIAHYASDGTIRLRLKPKWGGGISEGRWWLLDDGQQCRQFETGHKKEGCWRFYSEGEFVRFVPSSGTAVEGRAVKLPGNAVDD